MMLAEAFYECRDFKKAENLYKEAIQVRKQCGKVMKKSDGGSLTSEDKDNLSEDGRLAQHAVDVEVNSQRCSSRFTASSASKLKGSLSPPLLGTSHW